MSTRPFTKGELTCEYSGELISYEEAKKREEQYQKNLLLVVTCTTLSTRTRNCGK